MTKDSVKQFDYLSYAWFYKEKKNKTLNEHEVTIQNFNLKMILKYLLTEQRIGIKILRSYDGSTTYET